MKLALLARTLGAVCRGDESIEITGVAGIDEAGPNDVTFVANPKYTSHAHTTKAGAVLVTPEFPDITPATLRVANPYLAFAHAIEAFYKPPVYAPGIDPTASIDATASIGRHAHVGAYVVIGPGAVIGDHATLLPHVVIYPEVKIGTHFFAHAHAVVRESCRIGDHVLLQNGVIIGCDGFGFAKDDDGKWHKIPQSGPTVLGDWVEVQANSCVDRASVGESRIGNGSKLDNLVQVGHGSTVAENSLLCSQVGLAGSTHVGSNVILAGQVGVAGHCRIGDGVIAIAQAGLHGDIEPGRMLAGSPAFDHRQWLRATALFTRLPDLVKQWQRKSKQQ